MVSLIKQDKKDFAGLLWSVRNAHTDVEIRSPSGDIAWAHRALLAACSPFFRDILSDPDVNQLEKVVLLLDEEIHFPSILCVLRLLYAGRCREPLHSGSYESVVETIHLLNLNISGLEKIPFSSYHPGVSSREDSPDKYQCPLCPNKYEGLSGVRLHLAVHFKRQILRRISFGPNRVVQCHICSVATKSPLWHFGVKHHYIKDYLEPSLYQKFFSSHRYFNRPEWETPPPPIPQQPPSILPTPSTSSAPFPLPQRPALPLNKDPSYYERLHFKCPLCSETYRGLFNVRRHLLSHRRDEISAKIASLSPGAGSSSRCVLCSQKSDSILVHYAVEHGIAREFFSPSVHRYYFMEKDKRDVPIEPDPLSIDSMDESF